MRAREARRVGERASWADGAAEPPQGRRAQGTLEGMTGSCTAGKASGKQDCRRRTEQPCTHRRNVWVYLERQQEARNLGSDINEWAFHKPLASGGDRDLEAVEAPGSSVSRLEPWRRPQMTLTRNERAKAEVEKRR